MLKGNKTKMRNPFIMIGKIFKYEAMNLSRTFIPLFATILLLGVVLGSFVPKLRFSNKENVAQAIEMYESNKIDMDTLQSIAYSEANNSEEYSKFISDDSFNTRGVIVIILTALIFILTMATWILSIVMIDKRLKKTFNEDEATLNFTLPVTIGEHISGRFLCYLTFFIGWLVTLNLSALLSLRHIINTLTMKIYFLQLQETFAGGIYKSIGGHLAVIIITIIIIECLFISFVFFEKSIGMHFPKRKTIMQTIIEGPLIIAWFVLMMKIVTTPLETKECLTHLLIILINTVLVIFNIAFTYFSFKKKINIE